MTHKISSELATGLAYYKTKAALAVFSSYYLNPEEEYLFGKYYRAGESVLDLACGVGRTTLFLHEMGMRVRGVDLSDSFISTAKRRFPYLDFQVGSFDRIGERDSSFDHVLVSICGIDCAVPESQRIRALQECARVLKPNGSFICSSHNLKSLHWFSPYYNYRVRIGWKLRNSLNAFRTKCYIKEGEEYLFYSLPHYVVQQVEDAGLTLLEIRGFNRFKSTRFDLYFSPYIHYVFQKPVA